MTRSALSFDDSVLLTILEQLKYHDPQFRADMRSKLASFAVERASGGLVADAQKLFDMAIKIDVDAPAIGKARVNAPQGEDLASS